MIIYRSLHELYIMLKEMYQTISR